MNASTFSTRWQALLFLGLASAACSQVPDLTFSTIAGVANSSGSVDGVGANARFAGPGGVAADRNGNLYVADTGNSTIRKISSSGVVTTFAGVPGSEDRGDDGIPSEARFYSPYGVAVDSAGNVYVADTYNCTIRKISNAGIVTTLAGGFYNVYAPTTGSIDGVGRAALLNYPRAVAVDSEGNVYVADTGNSTIRRISISGTVTTVAGAAKALGSADGLGSAARFKQPQGLAVDGAGNIYVADTFNSTIRKITSDGVVTTLAGQAGSFASADGTGSAARFYMPSSVTVDSAGNLYVADTGNSTIRKVTAEGVVTTLAGTAASTGSVDGAGSGARFSRPGGVASDIAGNVYVADTNNSTIRRGNLADVVPPLYSGVAGANIPVGQTFVYPSAFSGGAIGGYEASGLPNGLSFDSSTGMIFGTPTEIGTFPIVLRATNALGTGTGTFSLVVSPLTGRRGYLSNLSVRSVTTPGSGTLIVGVVVGGSGTNGSKRLLIRAAGPSLASFGVDGFLGDPTMEFTAQGATTPMADNDDWGGNPTIAAVANAVGAFPFYSIASLDSALLVSPLGGAYSVKISGVGSSGITLGEIFDASGPGFSTSSPRLINISARAQVGSGAGVLIAGFVIAGDTPRTVLIRAAGPSLASYQVAGALGDPQLELLQNVAGNSVVLAGNDDWGDAEISSFGSAVGAFGFSSPTSKDAAILMTLSPGIYSARVSGVGGTTGIALIEIYEVP